MGLAVLVFTSSNPPWELTPHHGHYPTTDQAKTAPNLGWPDIEHHMARSGQRLPKYIARAFAGFWVAWPHLRVKCPGAVSWLFVCNAVLMGSWAGYADSGLALCKQVGDRPRLFAAVGLTGCLPWHPGHLGMY